MEGQEQGNRRRSRPALAGAARAGVFALAGLQTHCAFVAFCKEGDVTVSKRCLHDFSRVLREAGIASDAELARLWDDREAVAPLHEARQKGVNEAGKGFAEAMARHIIDLFSRTGGVVLTVASARRARTLMRRADARKPLYTPVEAKKINAAVDRHAAGDMEKVVAILRRAAARGKAGRSQKEEVNVALASMIACLARFLVPYYADGIICGPMLRAYCDVLCDEGLADRAALERLAHDRRGAMAPYHAAARRSLDEAAMRASDFLARIVLDVIGRTGGVAVTGDCAERAATLVRRMTNDERLLTDRECEEMDDAFGGDMLKNPAELAVQLRGVPGATVH